MEKLHYEIKIEAPAEKVYNTMLDDKHYREWTSVFSPGSYFKGSWEKGSKIYFLGADEEGNEGGMLSMIKENIPNEFVSIEHIGLIGNGEEITTGPEVQAWAGALENYSFESKNGSTLLKIDVDTNKEFKSYFEDAWPKALEKLKSICKSR
nr:SRPBCC domain-containing protein [Marivirga aurantiaca]